VPEQQKVKPHAAVQAKWGLIAHVFCSY